MERFSHKLAIAPTASISIICGGTSAGIEPIPANIYSHKTLSGTFAVKNPYLEAVLGREGDQYRGDMGLDPRTRRLGAAPGRPHPATKRMSTRPPSSWISAGLSNWPPTAPRKSASPSRSTSSSPATWTNGTCTCCTGRRGSGAASPCITYGRSQCSGRRSRARRTLIGRTWRRRRGRITRSVWPVSEVLNERGITPFSRYNQDRQILFVLIFLTKSA